MSTSDHRGRPLVAVTGIGLVTPLGFGVAESWAALIAGRSGIRRITRFPTEHLKTTIAGQVELPGEAALASPERVERMAGIAAAEAVGQAGIGGIVPPHERHLALGQRRVGQKPAGRCKRVPQREWGRQ